MNHDSVFRILAFVGFAFGAVHVGPILIALAYGELPEAGTLFVPLIGLTLASSLILVSFRKPTRKSQPLDGLAVVVLSWIVLPLVAGIPFAFATIHDNFLEAWHEAVSCLTTSGHSVLTLENPWPTSLIVYRGFLHLFGGLLTLVTVVSVFAAINLGGAGIHRTELFTIPEDDFFEALPHIVKVVLSVTLILTFIVFLLIWFSSGQIRVAFSDAISVTTTGWVDPERTIPRNIFHQLTLVIGLIVSSVGLIFLLHIRDFKNDERLIDPEVLTFAFLLIVFSILAIFAGSSIWSAIAWATSSLSTSGIKITNNPVVDEYYIALWLLPALIGGSGLSTAGGVKLARAYLFAKKTLLEFQHCAYPHSNQTLKFRGHKQSEKVIVGIYVYLVAYFAVTTIVSIGLGFSGQDYGSALTGAVGAISNSGFLVNWSTENGINSFSHILLILGQILGRMEILALIPVLSLEFWRR